MVKDFNSKRLNDIINELLISMKKSKGKAFKFYECIIGQINSSEKEIEEIANEMKELSNEIEATLALSRKYRKDMNEATNLLAKQNDLKQQYEYSVAYQKVESIILELKNMESEYNNLFHRRNVLDRELVKLKIILLDAEELIQSISTSLKYLNDDLSDVSSHLNEKEIVLLKIIEAGEIEKKIISRDIHDGPAQVLASLTMELQILKSQLHGSFTKDDIIEKVDILDGSVKSVLKEIRQIIYDLRPMSLDDLGLVPTIENYVKGFNERKGAKVVLKISDINNLSKDIPSSFSLAVFRMFQESLNNAYKHSNAKTIIISLEVLENKIKLVTMDNGKGFDLDETFDLVKTNETFGLLGMKERVALIDGGIDMKSTKNKGTTISIVIPWDSNKRSLGEMI